MEMPVKINPDGLIKSFVEIRYSSKMPFELAIGAYFNKFDDSYYYAGAKEHKGIRFIQNENGEFEIADQDTYLFFNNRIKIECLKDRFIFDMNDINKERNYIGWKEYFIEIKMALEVFFGAGAISHFKRIGIRYIGEYEGLNLNEVSRIYLNSELNAGTITNKNLTVEGTYLDNRFKIRLSTNHIPDMQTKFSKIDIDVINDNINLNDLNELYLEINKLHEIEKQIFFKEILSKEYLEKIETQY